jgi:hypothetical protein
VASGGGSVQYRCRRAARRRGVGYWACERSEMDVSPVKERGAVRRHLQSDSVAVVGVGASAAAERRRAAWALFQRVPPVPV